MRRLSESDKKEIEKSENSVIELARILGFSRTTIKRYVKYRGLNMPINSRPTKKYSVQIGGQYGRLTVMDRVVKDGKFYWLCNCSCGELNLIKASRDLFNAMVPSCGCHLPERHQSKRIANGAASANTVYCNYRGNARKRSIQLELTFEEFYSLCKMDCFYCGVAPFRVAKRGGNATPFIYNGIDRKNNEMGYVLDNCVSCCKECNVAKNSMSIEGFYSWSCRLSARRDIWGK